MVLISAALKHIRGSQAAVSVACSVTSHLADSFAGHQQTELHVKLALCSDLLHLRAAIMCQIEPLELENPQPPNLDQAEQGRRVDGTYRAGYRG